MHQILTPNGQAIFNSSVILLLSVLVKVSGRIPVVASPVDREGGSESDCEP